MPSDFEKPLPLEHVRMWMLLVVRGAAASGLTPMPLALFHRLVFLSNTLAALYDAAPPSEFVMKHRRGPFYPQAQRELEWLSVRGLTELSDLHWTGEGTIEASVTLSSAGNQLVEASVEASRWCRDVVSFLTDLAAAVASVDEGSEVAVADHDLTYSQKWARPYSVIAFRQPEDRLSVKGAQRIVEELPSKLQPHRQQKLRIYLQYLEELAA